MTFTALHNALSSALEDAQSAQPDAARVAEYRAATTAASFTDPQTELAAMQTGAAVYDLGFRAGISLTGGDRIRWMNGMVTNNVRDLAPGHGVYAFLLNPQGRILGDLDVYNRGESLLVDTDRSQLEKILATFDHYIIMDDVDVKNLSDDLTALGVAGPKSRAVLTAAGFTVPELAPLQLQDLNWHGIDCTLARSEDAPHQSYEIWLLPAQVRQLWDALLKAGATPVGFETLETQRILSGIPLYGADIRERDLPQETEQTRALNFNKGCYVGQEIVERIRSRGAVHRKFTGFVLESGPQIAPGARILAGEKEVGEITSVTSLPSPTRDATIALGYIRREVGIPGNEVIINGTKATVTQIPFEIAGSRVGEGLLVHR
jgi:folate-binding protein YgfZ